jgi:hypothetical protein
MSNNRSFVDFGRQRQLSDYGIRTISSAPPDGEYGLGAVDLALHLDRMIEQAFSLDPPAPTFETPPALTFEMLSHIYEELRCTSHRVVSFGTPRMEYSPFHDMLERVEREDPHDMAEMAVESHTPQAVERPMTRKESHEDWLKRTSALIDECQKARE